MIPDGNYLLYHLDLYYNARRAVLHAIRTGEEKEKILPLLEEMKNHAKEYDIIAFEKPGVYRYTVPHLRLIEEDTRAWLGSQGQCATDGFNSFLQEKPFDYLREDKAFQKLLL